MRLSLDLPSGIINAANRFLRISGSAFETDGTTVDVKITLNGISQTAIWGLPDMDTFDGSDASYRSGFTKLIDLGSDAFEREHEIEVTAQAGNENRSASSSFAMKRDRDAAKVEMYAAGTLPDFRAFGTAFIEFAQETGLRPSHNAVEIGPGAGRLSVAVAGFLQDGKLTAFDVDASATAFCQKNITGRYPNAEFRLVNQKNDLYNPGGVVEPVEGAIDVPAASQDFAYCWSVFTHLVEADFRTYINEFARVLHPGGLAVFSVFLYEPGKMNREFFDLDGGFWTSNLDKPEAAIAIEADVFESMVKEAGFTSLVMKRRSGGPIGGQDIAVAVR